MIAMSIALIVCLCCNEHKIKRPDIINERPTIQRAAERNGCRGDDLEILMAIRKSENGGKGRDFGVKHPRAWNTSLDSQSGWAAATVVKNRKRWKANSEGKDFITYLGDRYCPAIDDPCGNINWKRNVKYFYRKQKDRKMENECKGQRVIDFSKASRRSHPETSHIAESRITKTGSRQRHCDIILNTLREHNGSTSAELACYSPLTPEQCHKRMADLIQNEYIRRGDKRICRVKKTQCCTWWIK